MAVTLKIEDRERRGAAVAPADLADYEAPGERSEGIKTFLMWLLVMIVLAGAPALNPVTRGIGIGIFVWWLATSIGYFWLAPRLVLRRLRLHAPEYSIIKTKQPRLKTMLARGSALLGIGEPEGYLLPEGNPQLRIMGGRPAFIVLTQEARELLEPPELDCLLLRAMMHARQRHVRRLNLSHFLADTPPAARILVWPVLIYNFLLRHWWQDLALQTADRLTLLLTRNPDLLKSALLKMHVANDPRMQEQQITAQDVDNYIHQKGAIGTRGDEISLQYKIGQAIHDDPYLDERIEQIDDWAKSPEFKAAAEKLQEARAHKKA
jgi:Zn-dependent protease with chaperone function